MREGRNSIDVAGLVLNSRARYPRRRNLDYGDIGESWTESTVTARQFVNDLAKVNIDAWKGC